VIRISSHEFVSILISCGFLESVSILNMTFDGKSLSCMTRHLQVEDFTCIFRNIDHWDYGI